MLAIPHKGLLFDGGGGGGGFYSGVVLIFQDLWYIRLDNELYTVNGAEADI